MQSRNEGGATGAVARGASPEGTAAGWKKKKNCCSILPATNFIPEFLL